MAERTRWKAIAARVLEVAVVVAIGALIWSNYTLRARVLRAQSARPAEALRAFAVGERFDRVPVVRPDGSAQTLDLTSGRTLVAVLNPSCGSCQTSLAQLGAGSPLSSIVFAAKDSPPGLPEAAAKAGLGDRVYTISSAASPQFRERFVVNPQIFVVDRGKVVRICDSVAECGPGAY